jgi:hypothetical protein
MCATCNAALLFLAPLGRTQDVNFQPHATHYCIRQSTTAIIGCLSTLRARQMTELQLHARSEICDRRTITALSSHVSLRAEQRPEAGPQKRGAMCLNPPMHHHNLQDIEWGHLCQTRSRFSAYVGLTGTLLLVSTGYACAMQQLFVIASPMLDGE